MNCSELAIRLSEAGVSESAYTIGELYRNEVYVIAREGALWCVYYSERGLKTGLEVFATEDAACQKFFEWVVSDRTPSSSQQRPT
jgi:hypothetical protein